MLEAATTRVGEELASWSSWSLWGKGWKLTGMPFARSLGSTHPCWASTRNAPPLSVRRSQPKGSPVPGSRLQGEGQPGGRLPRWIFQSGRQARPSRSCPAPGKHVAAPPAPESEGLLAGALPGGRGALAAPQPHLGARTAGLVRPRRWDAPSRFPPPSLRLPESLLPAPPQPLAPPAACAVPGWRGRRLGLEAAPRRPPAPRGLCARRSRGHRARRAVAAALGPTARAGRRRVRGQPSLSAWGLGGAAHRRQAVGRGGSRRDPVGGHFRRETSGQPPALRLCPVARDCPSPAV